MKKSKLKKTTAAIIISILATIAVGFFYSRFLYYNSQKSVLNTLSEISEQNVHVLQKEIEKGQSILSNLAFYISQQKPFDQDHVIEQLIEVNKNNPFKRMGIILPDGTAYTTDHIQMDLKDREYFLSSLEGKTSVSDTLIDKSDGEKINVYSAPIPFEEGTSCVLFATYSSSVYQKLLSSPIFKGLGYSCIVKSNGDCIVASSDSNPFHSFDNLFDTLKQATGCNLKKAEALEKDMKDFRQGIITFKNTKNNYLYYQPLNINDWYLITVIPVAYIQNGTNVLLFSASVFSFVCVIVFTILLHHISKIKETSRKLVEEIAFKDKVTGGSTYDKFKLDAKALLLKYPDSRYAIISVNIDNFKYINNLYGFEEGNLALKFLWDSISQKLHERETFSRQSADHFVILLSYQKRKDLISRVEDIYANISRINHFNGKYYKFDLFFGIYEIDDIQADIDLMTDRSFLALKNRPGSAPEPYHFYDNTIQEKMLQNKEIENKFSKALANGEFIVYYQPKFNVKKQRFEGAEALVRWADPDKGLISPFFFIPVFEKNGSIVDLDSYIFEAVCKDLKGWIDAGYKVSPISVNVSRLHLYYKDFVESYFAILEKYQIPLQMIRLELTETALFENDTILKEIIHQFHEKGILILMDDFGSGYSSITMLKNIPIDILKIDKGLIDGFESNPKGKTILENIIKLCHRLDILVTAEGVETRLQYEELEKLNCDMIQGYYFARPMPKKDYEALLQRGQEYSDTPVL